MAESVYKKGVRSNVNLTRNEIDKSKDQVKQIARKNNPYDRVSRNLEMKKAERKYEKTGNLEGFEKRTEELQDRTLGGSAENFTMEQRQEATRDQDLSRRIKLSQFEYQKDQSAEKAEAVKDTVKSGFKRYDRESDLGINLQKMVRGVETKELSRELENIEADWLNDPVANVSEYKDQLSKMVNYFGDESVEGVQIKQKIRKADERSLTLNVQNARLAYEEDPAENYSGLQRAQEKLMDFYGSSEKGVLAQQSLRSNSLEEQQRLDTEASIQFEAGAIGYDEYSSYLEASLSKYPEGSKQYMQYYQASRDLDFNYELDQIMRQQYNSPPGEVQKNLKDFMSQFASGSGTYNTVQSQVDSIEVYLRKQAYQKQAQIENFARQGELNNLEAKMYMLRQDFANGDIKESKFKDKWEKYQTKIDYLSDPNTLPQFEMWNTYQDQEVNYSDIDVYEGYDKLKDILKGNISGVMDEIF